MGWFLSIILTVLFSLISVAANAAVPAYILNNNFHTHSTPLVLQPSFSSDCSVQTAGVYWLPDYLEKAIPMWPDSKPLSCVAMGYLSKPVYPYKDCRKFLAANKLYCYKNCSCDEAVKYNAENCKDGAILGNTIKNCQNKSDSCTCPEGYSLEITKAQCTAQGSRYTLKTKGTIDGQPCGRCEEMPCAGGGSSSCTGNLSSCGSSQILVSSCTDCDGLPRYTCRNKECATGFINLDSYWCNSALRCLLPEK